MRTPFKKTDQNYPLNLTPLTSMRFFAAFWVMLFHFTTTLPEGGIKDWLWVTKGYLAVDFFFILSGFIMCHVYGEKMRAGILNPISFYIRRFARLYPLHLLTLALYVSALLYLHIDEPTIMTRGDMQKYADDLSVSAILSNLFMVHGWGFEKTLNLNTPSWSISSEWFAYLIFPLLARKLLELRLKILAPFTAILFVSLWYLVPALDLNSLTQLTCDFSILRIIPEFILGMCLYSFGRTYSLKANPRFFLTGSLLLLFLTLQSTLSDIWIIPLFAGIIYLGAEANRHNSKGLLKTRPLIYLGDISYAIYMLHFPVMDSIYVFVSVRLFDNNPPLDIFIILWLSMFPITLILAAIAHQLIENPLRYRASTWISVKTL